jgi:hypothetical protein
MVTILLILIALGLLYAIVWLYARGRIVPAAVVLWIGFVPHEIWIRANCPGECNIRADLVLLLPVLLLVSIAAIVSVIHKLLRKRKSS